MTQIEEHDDDDDNDECLEFLPADVILTILEFYECPHYAPFYDEFKTEQSIKSLIRLFYGYFEHDPFRIIYPLFPSISTARMAREMCEFRPGDVEYINIGRCYPHYVKNLQVSDGPICELEDVTQTCLESLNMGPIGDDEQPLQKLLQKNPKLRKLYMQSFLDVISTETIQSFSNLLELDLLYNCTTINLDQFNEVIKTCTKLRKLSVSVDEMEEGSKIDVSKHGNLQCLLFDSYTIQPCEFILNHKIDYLLLQNTLLDANSTSKLFTSNQLKKLLLYHDCLDTSQVKYIAQNTSLVKLTCDDEETWTEILPLIVDHPNLNHLRMYMDGVSSELLKTTLLSGFSSMASRLKVLKLQWLSDHIGHELATALCSSCPSLEHLKLTYCLIRKDGTEVIAKTSKLKSLILMSCVGLDDQTVTPLLTNFPSLTYLELDTCSITENIADLIADNTTITDLSFNSDIGERGVKKILQKNRTLDRLIIEGTDVELEWLTPLQDNDTLLWVGLPLKDETWIDFYKTYPHIPHLTVTAGRETGNTIISEAWHGVKQFLQHNFDDIVSATVITASVLYFAYSIVKARRT